MMELYQQANEAEKTTDTAEEKRETRAKIKITARARHCRRRNKPHSSNRSGEQKNIDSIIQEKKRQRRNKRTTDATSQTVRNNNWK